MQRPALSAFMQRGPSAGRDWTGGHGGPAEPLETDDDYINYVNKAHQDWYQARYPYEAGWYLDVAFYLGLQWHRWYEASRQLRQPPAPSHRVRMVINRIYPTIKTLLGRFLRGQPRLLCSPLDSTQEAKSEAKLFQRLLTALWQHLPMFDVCQEWLLWALLTGTGIVKVGWDSTRGDVVRDLEGRPMYTGDIDIAAMGPFSIFVPPLQRNLTGPSRVLEVRVHPVEQVRQRFPDTGRDIQPETDLYKTSFYEERMQSLVSPIGLVQSQVGAKTSDKVSVLELWEDPQLLPEVERERFPTGRLIIAANKQLLFVGPSPFADGHHPYVVLKGGIFPGRFWGMALIDQLTPIQRAINKARSQLQEIRNLTAQPQIRAEKGHGIPTTTNEPGAWLEYTKGWRAPDYLQPPAMSPSLAEDINRLNTEFEDISQVHDVSRGVTPGANLTGVAINLLQEADQTPWGPLGTAFAVALAAVGEKLVARAQQFYTEPRLFPIFEEMSREDVLEFVSTGQARPLKVICDQTSVLPLSKAARMANVEFLLRLGVLNPVQDRAKILDLMEFGNVEALQVEEQADRQRAERENKQLVRGQLARVARFDNDEVHLEVHNRFRKSEEYEALPPDVQQALDQHCDEHLNKIVSLRAIMSPAPPAGGVPSGGGASPPPATGPIGAPPTGEPGPVAAPPPAPAIGKEEA